MNETRVSAHIDAEPDAAFAALTDPALLPRWNAAIRRVVDAPSALSEGAEWVVELHVLGQTWRSRAQVVELDVAARVFRYRSRTDGGNSSFADWSWIVTAGQHGGSDVTVSWDLHPKTFWRRALFVHIRRRQLRGEVAASIPALGTAARTMSPDG